MFFIQEAALVWTFPQKESDFIIFFTSTCCELQDDKDFATFVKNHLECAKREPNLYVQLQIKHACLLIYWAWFRPNYLAQST